MADIVTRLKIDAGDFDRNIKDAVRSLHDLQKNAVGSGASLNSLNKSELESIKSLGNLSTKSETAAGKAAELSKAFVQLNVHYKQLTDAERNGVYGKALGESLETLKTRAIEAKKAVEDSKAALSVSSESGGIKGILGGVGEKLGISGELLGGLSLSSLSYATVLGGVAAASSAATKALVEYNTVLAEQDQLTKVVTGLQGEAAAAMSDAAKSISSVYGVDFEQVINTANVLMKQFGESGEAATQLIRDGMQGMVEGHGGKFLQLALQFAPAFRDAGLSASQLVAIIQNSEGGLFSEQNLNAILMGIKNIRLMTDSTAKALAGLGIDGAEMSRKMSDGSMTVFEALQEVSRAIEGTSAGSKEAAEVMQQVFGRQGAVQGMKLGRAIASLNTDLADMKLQTGEVGKALAELELAGEALNKSLRLAFGVDGVKEFTTEIKVSAYKALTELVDGVARARDAITSAFAAAAQVAKPVKGAIDGISESVSRVGSSSQSAFAVLRSAVSGLISPLGTVVNLLQMLGSATAKEALAGKVGLARLEGSSVVKSIRNSSLLGSGGGGESTPSVMGTNYSYTPAISRGGGKSSGGAKTAQKAVEVFPEGSLAAMQAELKELTDAQKLVTSTEEWKKYADAIDEVNERIRALKGTEVAYIEGFAGVSDKALSGMKSALQDALSGMTAGSAEYLSAYANLLDLNSFSSLISEAIKKGVTLDTTLVEEVYDAILGGEATEIVRGKLVTLLDVINSSLSDGLNPLDIDFNTGKVTEKDDNETDTEEERKSLYKEVSKELAIANRGLSSIVGGVESLGIEVPKSLKSLISIISGITSILSGISALMSISSFLPFAGGGIVPRAAGGMVIPGNSFSGDNLRMIGVNSGELILNRAQQGNLASQLSGTAAAVSSTPYVDGERIILGVNNTLRRGGFGEIVTTSTLRAYGLI